MLNRNKYFFVTPLLALVLLTGCSLFSKPKGMAAVPTFKPGVTTINQATQVLGRPQSVFTQANGHVALGWLHPTHSNVGVGTEGVTILFGNDGRMIQVIQKFENPLGY